MSQLDSLSPQAIPPEDEALRSEVRQFLADALQDVPAHIRARSWSGYDPAFSRKLGARGWLGITLPREYGGGGRSAHARYVLVEEFLNSGSPKAPLPPRHLQGRGVLLHRHERARLGL